jgi:hypothetical protein
MSKTGWKGERQRHSCAARGIRMGTLKLNFTRALNHPNLYNPYHYKTYLINVMLDENGYGTIVLYPFDNQQKAKIEINVYRTKWTDEKSPTKVEVTLHGASYSPIEATLASHALKAASDLALDIKTQLEEKK